MPDQSVLLPAAVRPAHASSSQDVADRLATDSERGLDESEAASRLVSHGPNALAAGHSDPLVLRVLQQFHSPLIYVLLASALITIVLGEYVDASVILAVVLLNAVIGFLQESRALAALDSLRAMTHGVTRVVRAGEGRTIASEDVVVGDLVALEPGDKVPADLRVAAADDLLIDESALTGESTSVLKQDTVLRTATRVADRTNMLHAGSLVRSGTGVGVVVATAADTELGAIHQLVSTVSILATPLTRKLARFSNVLAVVIVGFAAAAFAIGLVRGEDAADMFTAVVALAVGAIPEGLPAAVTITLAIGVKRMVGRRAIVRRLPAVETLGSTTVICTDKTGTLTTNQMTVRKVWTPDGVFEVSGSGYDPHGELRDECDVRADVDHHAALRWCLAAGSACNDATVSPEGDGWVISGDPTEAAMKVVALKAAIPSWVDERYVRVATVPFDADRGYMATLHRCTGGAPYVILAKGGAERLVDLCTSWMRADGRVEPLDRAAIDAAVGDLAGLGMRVLATAISAPADPAGLTPAALDGALVMTGLQAMLDPPRPAVRTAIAACHRAGIEVKMITGDHAITAAAIAAEIGLDHRPPASRRVVVGSELAAMDAAGYAEAVTAAGVFARVSPAEKLRLVQSLQSLGHVVAMTGDGVNDAPALHQADIGIAMGLGGTEVAKDAADMVLVDDDFATIEAAVEEGRGVFDNLVKFIVWTLPTNLGEGLVILAAIVLGSALPILPTQVLWINMTTAVVLGLTLAFEPREAGIMQRAPRAPDTPLITAALLWRTVLVSGLLVTASWWVFVSEQDRGAGIAEARTAAANVFVCVEIAYLFSCRSLAGASWRLGLLTNRWVLGGVFVQVLAQAAFTYLPVMNDVFGTAPLGVSTWARIGIVVLVVVLIVAVDKFFAIRRVASEEDLRPVGQGPTSLC